MSELPTLTELSPEPMEFGELIAVMLLVGLAGCFMASVGEYVYDRLARPHLLRDGQYVFIFLTTIPTGWLLGAIAGLFLASNGDERRPDNRQVAWALLFAFFATPFSLLLFPFVPLVVGLLGFVFGGLSH